MGVVGVGIYASAHLKKKKFDKLVRHSHPAEIHPIDIILKEGDWKIIKSVEPSKFEVKDLELVSFKEMNRYPSPGERMRQLAVSLNADLGFDDAKRVFDQHKEIPVEFRSYCLVFPGTLLIGPGDAMGVVCFAYAFDDGWKPFVAYLNLTRWDDGYRLVRCKSAA